VRGYLKAIRVVRVRLLLKLILWIDFVVATYRGLFLERWTVGVSLYLNVRTFRYSFIMAMVCGEYEILKHITKHTYNDS
jgi:hypothetical protein